MGLLILFSDLFLGTMCQMVQKGAYFFRAEITPNTVIRSGLSTLF